MTKNRKAYLGTGWSFPPTFRKEAGQVQLVSAEEDIHQSLQILLTTRLRERVMQPSYGCDLTDFLFETLTPTVASNMKEQIRTAILYHEARIRLDRLDLSLDGQLEGRMLVELDYTIVSTNSRFNAVYPFYIQEGSGALLPVPELP